MPGEIFIKKKSYSVNRDAAVNKLQNRKAVFLDTNVWIDIAEERSALSKRLKSTLLGLVNRGEVFCPLSDSLLWELYKQNFPSRLRVGELMEALSLNVTFASKEEIFFWEIEAFVRKTLQEGTACVSPNKLYVPVVAYLSSRYELAYPKGWTEDEIATFERLFAEKMASLSLVELLNMRGDEFMDELKGIDTAKYLAASQERWKFTGGNKKKICRLEEETIARQYILPLLRKLPLRFRLPFLVSLGDFAKDEYGGCLKTMLSALPALKNQAEIMAIAGQDPRRRTRASDFYDLDMMAVPLAYTAVFVSQDKWIRDLLNNRGAILRRNTCQYLSSLLDFERWLKAVKR